MTAGRKIAVVGAGIIGSAVAWRLAGAGAAVTVFDSGSPGAGVTARAFGWINVAHGLPDDYARLRAVAIEDWKQADRALDGRLAPDWCGALTWSSDPARTETFVCDHARRGHNVRLVDAAEAARLEPGLNAWPDCAAFAADEGAVAPDRAARIFCEAARAEGAVIHAGTAVEAIEVTNGRVRGVTTGAGFMEADTVVLAAGTGSTALADAVGLDLGVRSSPAILVKLTAPQGRLSRIVSGTEFEARPVGPGRLVAAEDYVDDSRENGPDAIAIRVRDALRTRLGDGGIEVESVTVGWRPMPPDGLPVTGFADGLDGLYVVAAHAGVTLGPAIARIAAEEILD